MGVAAAFIFPATLAILTTVFTDHSERQKALGIWGATSGIAVAFGPITGGALLEHFWYGSIFLVNVPIVVVTLLGSHLLIPKLDAEKRHRFDTRGVLISTAGVTLLVLAIIEGPQWGWASAGTLVCFAAAAVLLTVFTLVELRTEKPLLDVRVFTIPRFSGGAVSIAVAFFCLFGFIFLVTQYFQFVKGYSALSAGVHTLPFAIVAAIVTPIAAVVALKVGSRLVVGIGLLLMGAGLVTAGLTSKPDTAFFGPIIVSMVLLALGLSSITAPATEAVMGSLAADQFGAGAAVNNTTRELGGTLGVAVLGSVFASAYAPRIIRAFGPYPIPAGPKQEAHQAMAAALAVVHHAPAAVQPLLRASAFSAFGAGFKVACLVGAGVAVIGALYAFASLPGRSAPGRRPGAGAGRPTPVPSTRSSAGPVGRAGAQSKAGGTSRVRFNSKKPGVPVTASTPSHSTPAASPFGAGVTTGPKKARPSKVMTGVPTSLPTWSMPARWDFFIASSNSSLSAASASEVGSPTSASASS